MSSDKTRASASAHCSVLRGHRSCSSSRLPPPEAERFSLLCPDMGVIDEARPDGPTLAVDTCRSPAPTYTRLGGAPSLCFAPQDISFPLHHHCVLPFLQQFPSAPPLYCSLCSILDLITLNSTIDALRPCNVSLCFEKLPDLGAPRGCEGSFVPCVSVWWLAALRPRKDGRGSGGLDARALDRPDLSCEQVVSPLRIEIYIYLSLQFPFRGEGMGRGTRWALATAHFSKHSHTDDIIVH